MFSASDAAGPMSVLAAPCTPGVQELQALTWPDVRRSPPGGRGGPPSWLWLVVAFLTVALGLTAVVTNAPAARLPAALGQ